MLSVRILIPWLIVGVLIASARAQPYGLTNRPVVGQFLDDVMPESAPVVSGNWSAVVAFTNLTFTNALGIAPVPGTSNLVVWEREGRIWSFTNNPSASAKTLVLDITNQCQGWDDSGLLNLAFHPGFVSNHFVFVYYTWVTPGTVVGNPNLRPIEHVVGKYHDRLSRFTLDTNGVAVPGSELVLVDQIGDSTWHNGSGLFFHPVNGFLYWTDGDDERAPTQVINQNLLSGVFRIDVDMRGGGISHPIPRQPLNGSTANYYVPNDNPFVGQAGVLEEFFAVGLRSPHRMTYDAASGRIFIGDVGASAREELDVIEPGDSPGLNFQWSRIEGLQGDLTPPYPGVNKRPILDYTHASGDGLAIIGGLVYHGSEFAADLGGKYIFGDNVSRNIWMLDESTSPASKILLCVMPRGPGVNSGSDYLGLSSFGTDQNGELYFCQMGNLGGRIYKLARSGPPPATRPMPPLLSQTGVFADLPALAPTDKLVPYTVNSPLWSDGAVKQRWMALPTNSAIHFGATGEWSFPAGTVFVKNFELATNDTNPSQLRRLETRLLVRDTNGTAYGVTYKWRPDNTEADLLTNSLTEDVTITTATGTRAQTWYYPSRQDCLRCHTPAATFVLGVKTRQLTGSYNYPDTGVTDVQLRAWNHIGLFDTNLNESAISNYDKLVTVTNTSASLEYRVRSYLDANCSQCHRPGGVPALWDARYDTPLISQGIVNGTVVDSLGILGAVVVAPQNLSNSIMFLRMNTLDAHKMPPLARNTIDSNAVATLAEWIAVVSPPGATNPPVLSQSPASLTRYINGNATFNASFLGTTPLAFQWRLNGAPLSSGVSNGSTISLSLSNLTAAQAGAYTLAVTNAYGETNTPPAVLTMLTPSTGTFSEMLIANQPVAYWRFNEPGNPAASFDLIGGHDLSNISVSAVTGVPAAGLEPTNLAAYFNGTTAGSQTAGPLMNAMSRYTVCGWFKPDTMPQPSRTALFGQNNLAEFGFHNSAYGIWVGGGSTVTWSQTSTLASNTWYFATATDDGTNLNLYLNGTLISNRVGTVTDFSSTYPFCVGYRVLDATGNYFRGAIDEVAVFDHALTAAQIQTLYQAATVGAVQLQVQRSGNNVVLTWPFGVLQSASGINGVYTNVLGASSPFTNSISVQGKYFRVRLN